MEQRESISSSLLPAAPHRSVEKQVSGCNDGGAGHHHTLCLMGGGYGGKGGTGRGVTLCFATTENSGEKPPHCNICKIYTGQKLMFSVHSKLLC